MHTFRVLNIARKICRFLLRGGYRERFLGNHDPCMFSEHVNWVNSHTLCMRLRLCVKRVYMALMHNYLYFNVRFHRNRLMHNQFRMLT